MAPYHNVVFFEQDLKIRCYSTSHMALQDFIQIQIVDTTTLQKKTETQHEPTIFGSVENIL